MNTTRREFVTWTAAAGVAAASTAVPAAAPGIVESDVSIPMAAGHCDAALFHPAGGSHPGVLIWTDIFGLRPVFRDFGRRLAAQGYTVLVPNPFYRTAKAPVIADVASFDFQSEHDRAKLPPLTGPLNASGAAEADAKSYMDFLDAQSVVDHRKKLGAQGYCMGGPLVLRTAAALPGRIGAGASFHGGGLVTDKPDSPHRLAPQIRAQLYIAIAGSDDTRQPDAKDALRSAFADAHVPAEIEVFTESQHGWCVADMPLQNGHAIYDSAAAERAWNKLILLYQRALV